MGQDASAWNSTSFGLELWKYADKQKKSASSRGTESSVKLP
jgi:hypothetical protein